MLVVVLYTKAPATTAAIAFLCVVVTLGGSINLLVVVMPSVPALEKSTAAFMVLVVPIPTPPKIAPPSTQLIPFVVNTSVFIPTTPVSPTVNNLLAVSLILSWKSSVAVVPIPTVPKRSASLFTSTLVKVETPDAALTFPVRVAVKVEIVNESAVI